MTDTTDRMSPIITGAAAKTITTTTTAKTKTQTLMTTIITPTTKT